MNELAGLSALCSSGSKQWMEVFVISCIVFKIPFVCLCLFWWFGIMMRKSTFKFFIFIFQEKTFFTFWFFLTHSIQIDCLKSEVVIKLYLLEKVSNNRLEILNSKKIFQPKSFLDLKWFFIKTFLPFNCGQWGSILKNKKLQLAVRSDRCPH